MKQSTSQEFDAYIARKKAMYTNLLCFIDNEDDSSNDFKKLTKIISKQKITQNPKDLIELINLIINIHKNHNRRLGFQDKIKKIILYYKTEIKQAFSNHEIFRIFSKDKRLLYFLFQKKIIKIDECLANYIIQKYDESEIYYFWPKLKSFIDLKTQKRIIKKLSKIDSNIFNNFHEKYEIGENDSYICELIRNDEIDEFIVYINKKNISLSSQITQSIFESNPLILKDKKTSLIEYSAFFGAVQIFNYLLMNNVKLTSSLWIYAIHSNNAEIIYLLEENKVSPYSRTDKYNLVNNYYDDNFIYSYREAIKCHHNEIAKYIEINYLTEKPKSIQFIQEFIIKSYNYEFFIDNYNYNDCDYNYDIFKFLCANNYYLLRSAAFNNNCEIVNFLLSIRDTNKIESNLFLRYELNQIDIPSSIKIIDDNAFKNCEYLFDVSINSSVTQFGCSVFENCALLNNVKILSDLKSIEPCTFKDCSLLKEIEIPSSVTNIKIKAFNGCSSLKHIVIPSSVTRIGCCSFAGCSSLTEILIPSSVTIIDNNAFEGCSSLIEMTIPSTVNEVGLSLFKNCTSLTNVSIQSLITQIGASFFEDCSSLKQVSIPPTVSYIGMNAFKGCSSLIQFPEFPLLNEINIMAFKNCSSLKEISIPSSVTLIKNNAFEGCSSVTQIEFKTSQISLGNKIFNGCSSLEKIIIPSSLIINLDEIGPNINIIKV